MVAWDSHNQESPPSLLYPPDGAKWITRKSLRGTLTATGINGKQVCIGELRGWLRGVSPIANDDPDWHYDLEIDPQWLDTLGTSLAEYSVPGDAILWASEGSSDPGVDAEVIQRSSMRAIYTVPYVHIELDGWPRSDQRGAPAQPLSWIAADGDHPGIFWPYDPRQPAGTALAEGQYIRIVGSLVTDEAHSMEGVLLTRLVLAHGPDKVLNDPPGIKARWNAIKWIWAANRTDEDESNPARWNEIHSPDYFEITGSQPARTETARLVAISAQHGLLAGEVEELTAEIRPPTPRATRWQYLNLRKSVGYRTTEWAGAVVETETMLGDRVKIHVKATGKPGVVGDSVYFAAYRVSWRTPRLTAAHSANGVVLICAVDTDGKVMIRPGDANSALWGLRARNYWEHLRDGYSAPIGAVGVTSRASDCLDAFVVGTDGRICTAATQGAGWGGWWTIDGLTAVPGSPIGATSRSANKLDIFLADGGGRVMSAAWETGFANWHGWWHIKAGMTAPGGDVASISRSTDILDLFVAGTDGRVYTTDWSPTTGWDAWYRIGDLEVIPGSPVGCVSCGPGKVDIFIADVEGRVMRTSRTGNRTWSTWRQVGNGAMASGGTIAVASHRADWIDLVLVGTDGQVWSNFIDPANPNASNWSIIPGMECRLDTPIAATSPKEDLLVVVATNINGRLLAANWSPGFPGMAWWTRWLEF